jgi:hypothetical protein
MALPKWLSWLPGVKQKVSAFFVAVFGSDAAHKFADGSVALLKTELGKIALDAVAYAATLKLGTSKEVHDAAAVKIEMDALSSGVSVTNGLINLVIELAYQALIKQNIPLPQ